MHFEEGVITINNKNILENTTTNNNRFKTQPTKRIRELKNKLYEKNYPVNNNQQ
jgi:hypothetical protein